MSVRMMADITPSEVFNSLFHPKSGYLTRRNDIGHLKEQTIPFCKRLHQFMKDDRIRNKSSKEIVESIEEFRRQIHKRRMGGGYHKMTSISVDRNLNDLFDTLLSYDGVEKDSGYMRRWFLDPLRRIMKNPKNAMFLYPVVAISGKREDYRDFVPCPICLVEIYDFLINGEIVHEGHLRFLLDMMCSNVKLYTVNTGKDVYRHANYLSTQISKEFHDYKSFSALDSPSHVSPWNLQPVRSLIYQSLMCCSNGRRRRVMRLLKRIDQRRVGFRMDGSMELEVDKLSDETIIHLSDYMSKWGKWSYHFENKENCNDNVCNQNEEDSSSEEEEYLSQGEREEREREEDNMNGLECSSEDDLSSSSRCGSSCDEFEDYE